MFEIVIKRVAASQTFDRASCKGAKPFGNVIVRRQSGWVFECFGEVARATAADGETNDDFTTTAELRRLGL